MKRKIVFIGGLHRSGTTALNNIIGHSQDVSGIIHDEGVNIQTVCKSPDEMGAAGRFAFHGEGALNEKSPLVTPENRERLLKEWGSYWDVNKAVWSEKSPPNIIRMRFLQALFPEAYFINIIRHPVPVSLATNKWTQTSGEELIDHWIKAYEIYQQDKPYIQNELFFSYEYFAKNPERILAEIEGFLAIKINYDHSFQDKNEKYFKTWLTPNHWEGTRNSYREKLISKYENKINEFGYSLSNLDKYPALTIKKNNLPFAQIKTDIPLEKKALTESELPSPPLKESLKRIRFIKQLTLITFLFDRTAFEWGLKLEGFKTPTIIIAHPNLEEEIEKMDKGVCRVEYHAIDKEVSFYDSVSIINGLHEKGLITNESIIFCESMLLYKQISFDLVYQGIFQQAILNKEFNHHNLAETVRMQGLFFTLNVSLIADIKSNLINQILLGEELTELQPAFPMVSRFTEDVNLIAINEIKGKTLHLIGDSHSLLTLTPNKEVGCRSHILFDLKRYNKSVEFDYQFTHHLGSKTMHGFSFGEEFPKGFLEKQGVKNGDSVIFVFGEIDIRSHIYKYVNEENNLTQVIEKLIDQYLKKIIELTEETMPNISIMGVIPPMDGPNYKSEEYPIQGSLSQRVEATRLINQLLAVRCKKRGIGYFELNDLYALENGSLDLEQSDLFCHISHHHQEKAIKRMLKIVST